MLLSYYTIDHFYSIVLFRTLVNSVDKKNEPNQIKLTQPNSNRLKTKVYV